MLRELYRSRRRARSDEREIEQVAYLLFLKMADERGIGLPAQTDWRYLRTHTGHELIEAYAVALRRLRREPGMLGELFQGAESPFTDPALLEKLIGLVDEMEWISVEPDARAVALGRLVEKAFSGARKGTWAPALSRRRSRRALHFLDADASAGEAVYGVPPEIALEPFAPPARPRLAWLGLTAWCIASAVLVFAFSGTLLTAVAVVPFVLFGPGIGVVLLLHLSGWVLRGTVVLLTGVATSVLVPSILLYAHAWSPRAAFAIVAGLTLAMVSLGVFGNRSHVRREIETSESA